MSYHPRPSKRNRYRLTVVAKNGKRYFHEDAKKWIFDDAIDIMKTGLTSAHDEINLKPNDILSLTISPAPKREGRIG